MSKKVPFESSYDTIRKFEKAGSVALIISASIITLIWLLSKMKINQDFLVYISPIEEILKIISYTTIVGYIGMSLISKILFASAEKLKREDLIDNSFETTYTTEKSVGYYTNDDVQIGIKRMTYNTHESSFHTENTLRLMLIKISIKYLIFIIPFILSIFTSNGHTIIRLLFEMGIPIEMTIMLLTTLQYYINVKSINERFKLELLSIGKRDILVDEHPKLIFPIMEYYNIKSWASINLDKDVFDKNKDKLSDLWKLRKLNYLK